MKTQETLGVSRLAKLGASRIVELGVSRLVEMLAHMRPAGSKTERRFIRDYISPLGMCQDKAGNLYKRIGTAPVLWSCHTDTVHRQGGKQTVIVDGATARLPYNSKSNCLGADDTVGVWLMCEMIQAGIEGLYIFHRGEECGGIGSDYIAKKTPELLKGIKCAIAFDRYGYEDVITHQFGTRCCSDVFAKSLAYALGLGHAPDDGGTFTDTAQYTDLIGECTNVAVGYHKQHTFLETCDLAFAWRMRNALMAIDLSALVFKREPGEWDPLDYKWSFGNSTSREDVWDNDNDGATYYKQARMSDIVKDYPEEIADILCEFGLDGPSLMQEIYARGGAVRY